MPSLSTILFISMIRSYRYPLHPTQAQEAVLHGWLAMACDLYNGALQERREAWKRGVHINYPIQCKSLTEIRATVPGWSDVPAEMARSALRRLDKAMAAYFRRVKENKKNGTRKSPGYPRFRSKRRYDSFSIGTSGSHSPLLIQGRHVQIPKLGLVKFNQYRPIPHAARVLDVVVRRELGKWFVIFQCNLGAAPAKRPVAEIPLSRQVGIDVGLTTLATLSTGEPIENPHHGRDGAAVLARRAKNAVDAAPS